MSDYALHWSAASSSTYLGGTIVPSPAVSLALSPVAHVWTDVFAALAADGGDSSTADSADSAAGGGNRKAPGGAAGAAAASHGEGRAAAAGPRAGFQNPRGGRGRCRAAGSGGRHDAGPAGAPGLSRARAVAGGGNSSSSSNTTTTTSSSRRGAGLARGAVRFTSRMMNLVLGTGDCDLICQVLLFLERHEAQLQVA